MRSAPRAPLLGIEAEFLGWTNGVDPVVERLIDHGYTLSDYYEEHSYHCDCRTCWSIGNSGPMVPVLWKRQHDASLTDNGTEWISSPFPAIGAFMEQALEAIELMSEGDLTSVDQGRRENRRMNGNAEAGLHIHCSTSQGAAAREIGYTREFARVMRGYAPEILALTIPTKLFRSATYRSLALHDAAHPHRVFLNCIAPGRVEWRMFEPAYAYPKYMEAVLAITSTLTVLMNEEELMSALDIVQSYHRWGRWAKDDELINPQEVLAQFSEQRAVALLTALETISFDKQTTETAKEYCQEAWNL